MSEDSKRTMSKELQKLGPGEGELFDIAGARFLWKVKNEGTGNSFSMYEMELVTGDGAPLHFHPYSEVFYVLRGEIDFLDHSQNDWVRAAPGETVVVPANKPHAFYNRTGQPAKLLSISNQRHQRFFDEVAAADWITPFSIMPFPEALERVGAIGAENEMYFMPFEPPVLI
jgi:quercetin dioxygenase-like cupin family protein